MGLFVFLSQVKAEVSKIIWPARREVLLTALMVFLMTLIVALFLLLTDQLIGWSISYVLGIFS